MSKRKRQTLRPGQIAVDAASFETMLTLLRTAIDNMEGLGTNVLLMIDSGVVPQTPSIVELRENVTAALVGYQEMKATADAHSAIIRLHIAASRSGLASGSERVN